jgi:hypothetical protein
MKPYRNTARMAHVEHIFVGIPQERMHVTDQLAIRAENLSWRFVRAPGPGGQNVKLCGPPAKSARVLSAMSLRLSSALHHRRLSPGRGGGILQAPWPIRRCSRRRGTPSLFQALLASAADLVSLTEQDTMMDWRKIDCLDLSNPEHKIFAPNIVTLCRNAARFLGTEKPRAPEQFLFSSGNIRIDFADGYAGYLHVIYKEQLVVHYHPFYGEFHLFRAGQWIDQVESFSARIAAAIAVYQSNQEKMKQEENKRRFGRIDG